MPCLALTSDVLIEPCGIETCSIRGAIVEDWRVLIEPCGIETCFDLLRMAAHGWF